MDKRFQTYKVSVCGDQIKRDYQQGLTLEQARSKPLGLQNDKNGSFIWAYSVTGLK